MEVERKFSVSDALVRAVAAAATSSRVSTFSDTYWDTAEYFLSKSDYWARQRCPYLLLALDKVANHADVHKWELKMPASTCAQADSTRQLGLPNASLVDHYAEVIGAKDSMEHIAALLGRHAAASHSLKPPNGFAAPSDANSSSPKSLTSRVISDSAYSQWLNTCGVYPWGTITTVRTRFQLYVNSIPVQVDIDDVSFDGHPKSAYRLGEVEVMTNTSDTSGAGSSSNADQIIEEVWQRFHIPTAPVRGKVLECLSRHHPLHFRALAECGMLSTKGLK